MISNIYAKRNDIELVSPERVSGAAKAATLPDFEIKLGKGVKILDNGEIVREA